MRVLIILTKNPNRNLLVKLHTEELVKEIKELISKRNHSHAITTALTKGRFEKELRHHEISKIDADLILSEENARWDLT